MTSDNSIPNRSRKVPPRRGAEAAFAAQHSSDPALRETGIRVMGDMPWGTHLCVFFETKEDLLDTAATYFSAGLESNELCVWAISDPITEEDAKKVLRREIPDFNQRLAHGHIEILQGTEWYLKGDQFDLRRITSGWSEKLSGALARGYEGMRVSGNAFWFESKHWKEFCEYEHELDSLVRSVTACSASSSHSYRSDNG